MKQRLSIVAGLAVTALFLWLAVRNVQVAELIDVLKAARWRWLLVMVPLFLVDLAIRALRWRILLSQAALPKPQGRAGSLWLLFRLEAIGLAVNNVLFARIGELARAALAARELGIPVAVALASVAIERALDLAALLALFVIVGSGSPLVEPNVLRGAGVLLTGVLAALLVLVLAEKLLEPKGPVDRRLARWPGLRKLVSQLVLGASVLRRPSAVLPAAGLSVALWLSDASICWAAARALGLGAVVDYPRSILILSWAGASSALPAAPGAIGTYEAMVKSILVKMGANVHEAFAYAVFNHMTMYLFVTALGLGFLYKIGLSLGGLRQSLEKP